MPELRTVAVETASDAEQRVQNENTSTNFGSITRSSTRGRSTVSIHRIA